MPCEFRDGGGSPHCSVSFLVLEELIIVRGETAQTNGTGIKFK